MIPNIAILLACYNRKETTIKCLDSLFSQYNDNEYEFNVFLVDDNSIDGTKEEVLLKYPTVNVIDGTGDLFWGGGMYLAWYEALKSHKEFEYYLWLNDDVNLCTTALHDLLLVENVRNNNVIVCGSICDEQTEKVTIYGGLKDYKYPKLIEPNGIIQNCDFCNGNVVLIPQKIVDKVGIINPYFRHFLGDYEYTARVVKAGFSCCVTPGFCGMGNLNFNDSRFKCFSKSLSIIKRIKILYSPKGVNPFREYKFFKNFSYNYAIWVFLELHLMTFFPKGYKRIKRLLGIK